VRLLSEQERCALRTFGPPDEGPVPQEVFDGLKARGYGFWAPDGWTVTPAGERALEADTLARHALGSTDG